MIERILVLGGKGGVGKSTISAATAVALSDALPNKKILLISFDMAHNLSDLFKIEIGEELTQLTDNLWGIEPDPNLYAEEYTREFSEKLRALMKKMPLVGNLPQIKEFIDKTFTADSIPLALKNSMFFQKILDAEDLTGGIRFDLIVADFPPTGNMIALFEIPEDQVKVILKYSLNFFNSIKGALKGLRKTMIKIMNPFTHDDGSRKQLSEEVYRMLQELDARGDRITQLIHSVGSLRLVTIAEKPSFEEIKRARELSKKYITLDAIHANMLIPRKNAKKCDFCGKIRETQQKYMQEIHDEFSALKIWESNKLVEEPIGLNGLRAFAREVYGDINADDILFPKN
ncbi:MAG: TRC40/GET3/ArsA family transport-energizing ATPase [Candidatus Lokiarchaeota archaeon]|nr:TRC40/GET3/ArsA family transport-energizing ATPase [Candidatus Lokiarchaeota archaeon]